MPLHDTQTYRQSKSGPFALIFRREKWIENSRQNRGRNAAPGILNADETMGLLHRRADGQDAAVSHRLAEMRRALPGQYRRDLFDLRVFFALGGLRNDPFWTWRSERDATAAPLPETIAAGEPTGRGFGATPGPQFDR